MEVPQGILDGISPGNRAETGRENNHLLTTVTHDPPPNAPSYDWRKKYNTVRGGGWAGGGASGSDEKDHVGSYYQRMDNVGSDSHIQNLLIELVVVQNEICCINSLNINPHYGKICEGIVQKAINSCCLRYTTHVISIQCNF